MHDRSESLIKERLTIVLNLTDSLVNYVYPGEWKIIDGQLYKGQTLINRNYTILDTVSDLSHTNVSIFAGDIRVATTLKDLNGNRIEDTLVDNNVINNKLYVGNTVIFNTKYMAAYKPIISGNNVIGLIGVGIEKNKNDTYVNNFSYTVAGLGILIILLNITMLCIYLRNRGNSNVRF
jgi:methyl-accepting chemotaxis protein